MPTEITWAPSVEDVAALIRARTKQLGGGEAGTFNDDTRPTGAQVQLLINQAARRVASSVGVSPCTEDLQADAKDMAATYAAMLIEQSYWPEQTRNEGSSFRNLKQLWDDGIQTLMAAVREICGGAPGSDAGGAQMPRHSFPAGPLVSERTVL